MDSVIPTDVVVRTALFAGLALLTLATAILMQVLAMGLRARLDKRRQRRFVNTWRPIMAGATIGEIPEQLPAIHWKDRLRFLLLWNRIQQNVRGPATKLLNQLLVRTGMDGAARLYLDAGSPSARMIGITTLRYLAPPDAHERLVLLAQEAPAPVALAAARTLVMIDAQKNLPELIPIMLRRRDWTESRCLDICRTAGTESATANLLPVFRKADDKDRTRLLPLLECVHVRDRAAAMRDFLDVHPDDGNTATALDLLAVARRPEDIDRMRALLDHQQAHVRTIAAWFVGVLGHGEEDLHRLEILLGDHDWHVRQSAAAAIVVLHDVPRSRIEDLAHTLTDRYGQQALQRALETST